MKKSSFLVLLYEIKSEYRVSGRWVSFLDMLKRNCGKKSTLAPSNCLPKLCAEIPNTVPCWLSFICKPNANVTSLTL